MAKKAARKAADDLKSGLSTSQPIPTVPVKKAFAKKKAATKKVTRKKAAKKSATNASRKTASRSKSSGKQSKLATKAVATSRRAKPKLLDFGVPMEEIREYNKQHFFELEESKLRAQETLDRHRESLKANPHVTGMHVGLRRRDGKVVWPPTYCIRVHVREKFKPDAHPRITQAIRPILDGVEVDVYQQNYESMASSSTTLPTIAPAVLVGGLPIANFVVPANWGTLGMPLFQNAQRVFLTNQHVVGSSAASETRVIQPPANVTAAAVIGNVTSSRMDGIIDAAVISSNGSRSADNEITGLDGQILLGVLLFEDQSGGVAFKIGAASGSTPVIGRIKSANASVLVDDQRWMDNQIIVDPPLGQTIVTGGDSGSVLLQKVQNPFGGTTDTYEMVGLVHGGTKQGSLVACHMYKVFRAFKLSLFPQ